MPEFDPLRAVHYIEHDPGERWRKDDHIALDLDHPLDSERILTPNVLRVAGGYRMYYTGLGPARRDPDAPGYILSAVSDDGLSWSPEEGVRFGDGRWSYGRPRVMYVERDVGTVGYRMYFHRYTFPLRDGLDAGNHIIGALRHRSEGRWGEAFLRSGRWRGELPDPVSHLKVTSAEVGSVVRRLPRQSLQPEPPPPLGGSPGRCPTGSKQRTAACMIPPW